MEISVEAKNIDFKVRYKELIVARKRTNEAMEFYQDAIWAFPLAACFVSIFLLMLSEAFSKIAPLNIIIPIFWVIVIASVSYAFIRWRQLRKRNDQYNRKWAEIEIERKQNNIF